MQINDETETVGYGELRTAHKKKKTTVVSSDLIFFTMGAEECLIFTLFMAH